MKNVYDDVKDNTSKEEKHTKTLKL